MLCLNPKIGPLCRVNRCPRKTEEAMRRCILNAGIPVFNHRLQDESLDRGEGLVLFDVQRLEAGGREVGLKS